MTPKQHKSRLLKLIVKLREEVCATVEHGHVKWPYKTLHEIELDMHDLEVEIERVDLVKSNKHE